jgi:NADPH:quinone reductase-like Zn-dependent oxidoreductase
VPNDLSAIDALTWQAVGRLPDAMVGVVLTGYGGFERLEYRDDLRLPKPGVGEVLVNVHAAGMNNTDINTRTGWYHQGIDSGSDVAEGGMGAWAGDVVFPRIQGADVSGHIVATGPEVDARRLGERVVCDPYCRAEGDATGIASAEFLGAERDGGFAQFCRVPSVNAHLVPDVAIDDAQLATLPCSAGTAMNMLLIASVGPGDRVIVTGGSGGVGTFLIQIARHLGAEVAAIASLQKHGALAALGAHMVDRACADPVGAARDMLGAPPTVIADVVGGEAFGSLIDSLGRGGRYVAAGAVAGPLVELDLRTLYLRNLEFYGSAAYRRDTFPTLMRVLASGGLDPRVDSQWPLDQIVAAQGAFLARSHIGSMVLVVPPAELQ